MSLERALTLARIVMAMAVAVAALSIAIRFQQTLNTVDAAIEKNSTQAYKMMGSYRAVAVDLRQAVTHNKALQEQLQAATFGTVENLNAQLARSMDMLNTRADTTLTNVDGLVTDARALVTNTDFSLNDPDFGVLPAAADAIRTLDGRVAVLFDNDIQGLTEAACTSIQQAGADVHAILGSDEIPMILREVRVILENGESITLYAADISKNAAEVSQHYTDKLVRPSGWDRLKWVLNVALYGFGEIITPWAISARVQDVQVIP